MKAHVKISVTLGLAILLIATMVSGQKTDDPVKVNDDDINRMQTIGPSGRSMVMMGDTVYCVWQDNRDFSDEPDQFQKCDVYFAKGTLKDDGPPTFSANVMVNDFSGGPNRNEESRPDLAVSSDGKIHVVWTDKRNIDNQLEGNDIFYSRSLDGGTSFQDNELIGCDSGFSTDAAIATSGNHVYIVYRHSPNPQNVVVNMVVSDDGGINFGEIKTVYIPNSNYSGGEHLVLEAEGSNVYLAFRDRGDEFNGNVAIMKSTDNGETFSERVIVNDDEDDKVQDHISLSVSGEHVYLTWMDNRISEPVGIYFAASHDGGSTFGSNQMIAPHTGGPFPSVSSLGSDVVITYSRGHEDVYGDSLLARISHDNGTTWGDEVFISNQSIERPDIGPSIVSVVEDGFGTFFMDDHIEPDTGDDMYFRYLEFNAVETNETDDDTTDDDSTTDDDDTSDDDADGESDEDEDESTPGFGMALLVLSLLTAAIIIKGKNRK